MELNLFHDSANLLRLALRLRLRLSVLSSRSEQPRSISPASLHFLPMLSRCGRTRGDGPRPWQCLAAAGAQLSPAPPSLSRLPPETRALYRRPQAALATAIGSTGTGAASATCAPARFLIHPNCFPSSTPAFPWEGRGDHTAHAWGCGRAALGVSCSHHLPPGLKALGTWEQMPRSSTGGWRLQLN